MDLYITAYPYAACQGMLSGVPEDLIKNGSNDAIHDYVSQHFNDIRFGSPDLDFGGTDMEIMTEEGETL